MTCPTLYPLATGKAKATLAPQHPGRGQQPVLATKPQTAPITSKAGRAGREADPISAMLAQMRNPSTTPTASATGIVDLGFAFAMPRILTNVEAASYRITAIPSSPATTVVAISAERSVKRRPSLRAATPARAKIRAGYQRGK